MEVGPEHLAIAARAAKIMVRRTGHSECFEDFYSVACESLVANLPGYDPSMGTTLETYLINPMKFRILDHLRNELGRSPGSMRRHEILVSPVADENVSGTPVPPGDLQAYWYNTHADPRSEAMYDEVDDADERTRALAWAYRVLSEELTATQLVAIQAWIREGRLKAAGEAIGKTESWVCRCVIAAEEKLNARRAEVIGP